MVVSSLFDDLVPPIVNRSYEYKILLPHQIILYGLQNDVDTEYLDDKFVEYYKASKINKLNSDLIKEITNGIIDNYVHIILDMKVFGEPYIKHDKYDVKDPLNYNNLNELLMSIKNNIVSMDIVEFNPLTCVPEESKKLREFGRNIIRDIFNIIEKSINIINEHTQFLIYRPLDQINSSDIGWNVLVGLNINEMNEMLKIIGDDEIKTLDIDGEDYLITKTCMEEQNKKTFYHAKSVSDAVLFPDEKIDMCFKILGN